MKSEQNRAGAATAARQQVMDLLRKVGENFLEKRDETKYVELELEDAKPRGGEPEHELRSGGTTQMSGGGAVCEDQDGRGEDNPPHPVPPEDRLEPGDNSARAVTHPDVSKGGEAEEARAQGIQDGGDYLSRRSESEDGEEVSLVLFDDSGPRATEDESHYITTHEIQLSELSDHEGDCDLGVASSSASWDLEDDHQAYSFVDYAFESDGAEERGREPPPPRAQNDPAEPPGSEERAPKPQQEQQQRGGGQIHLSIRTTSRAINDPGSVQEQENLLYHATRAGDVSRYVFRGVDGSAEQLRDRAKCLIAAPGRLHFGGKFRGKEVTGYSSGTSSAVSELDDADKEVRSLTARAFKSLAYPYFDAINFSTSSESSASEHGLGINRWSTFVDLKYGNVNMSDQSVVSCQNSFEIAKNLDNRGYKGVALAALNPPSSNIFTLNGNPQQIQLMGPGGVIRLTETLNFRCNVKSGMSAGERRANFAQSSAGSRSADEVTGGSLRSQRRGAGESPRRAMEDAHKKAIFASSLIKNVISKKMQFEQERKMERGEIVEPQGAPSPCDARGTRGGGRELQSSGFSESGSDYAIMCAEDLGDFVDSGSCDTGSDSRRHGASAPASGTNLEPASEGGIDTKKGALEASKSTLLRSQNSAFRCWKDEDLGFQKDHKSDKTPEDTLLSARDEAREGARCPAAGSKLTKMSHLFVPSIQLLSSDDAGQQLRGDSGGIKLRSDNTLYITESTRPAASKPPEIKINLRSVRDHKAEPFGVSKLRAPNLGCGAASLIRAEDLKCQALAAALKGESADKVPHFTVRDIRDNKGKLQTPIHQVRDVRKLVKSSYHFVSLDSDSKASLASDSHAEPRRQVHGRPPHSVSPIVIKCQSVNTNNAGREGESLDLVKQEPFEADQPSLEGAQTGAGRAPLVSSSPPEGSLGLGIESKMAPKKQEKVSDVTEKKPESKMANQAALEKLQAAVKTMEQLYVFEKNEWKRKNEPEPLMDSHVLSLITREEQGGPEEEGARGSRRDSCPSVDKASPGVESLLRREDRDLLRALQASSSGHDDRPPAQNANAQSTLTQSTHAQSVHAQSTYAQSTHAQSAHAQSTHAQSTHAQSTYAQSMHAQSTYAQHAHAQSTYAQSSHAQSTHTQSGVPQMPLSKYFVPKSPKLPVSLRASQTRGGRGEGGDVDRSEQQFSGAPADNENYLTIPVKPPPSNSKQPPAEKTSVYRFAPQPGLSSPPEHDGPGIRVQEDRNQMKRSSIVMETRSPEIPSATIYHSLPLGVAPSQPQVYCFSPAVTPAPTLDPFQPTQRKMLLDPTTGNYYLVDTPVQPATRRLFDPETGQYVDVPVPQPPMTPVPVPMSPLTLSPGAYGHTYMIYPGFMPAPSLMPARTLVQSQVSSDADGGEKVSSQGGEGMYMDTPFYMATGKSPQAASGAQQPGGRGPHGFSSIKQPVISITSQQGPRIIAPPSFDGTTMSFVVEHR